MWKNKVLEVAFGTDEEIATKPTVILLTRYQCRTCRISKDTVRFSSPIKQRRVRGIFKSFEEELVRPQKDRIVLEKGFETLKQFSHSMEPYLRQLKLPTRLVNSQIELQSDYLLAEEDKPLTVEKCKLLVLDELFLEVVGHQDVETQIFD